jgi:hypothetical protein
VGKRSVIPRGVRIGRNVKIGGDVRRSDYTARVVKSGSTVERKDAHRAPRVAVMAQEREDDGQGAAASIAGRTHPPLEPVAGRPRGASS